jgi:hypothetical protein
LGAVDFGQGDLLSAFGRRVQSLEQTSLSTALRSQAKLRCLDGSRCSGGGDFNTFYELWQFPLIGDLSILEELDPVNPLCYNIHVVGCQKSKSYTFGYNQTSRGPITELRSLYALVKAEAKHRE